MNGWNSWNFTRNFTLPIFYDFSIFNTTTIPIFILFAVVSWVVNITVLITIFIDRLNCLKKMSGWFVASISIASIILATSVILFAMQFVPETKIKSQTYWKVLPFLIQIPISCTLWFIMIISLERLFLISKPLRYKIFMTETKTKSITIFIWVVSIGVSIVKTLLRNYRPEIHKYSKYSTLWLYIIIVVVDAMTFYKLKTMNKALVSITDTAIRRVSEAKLKMEKRFSQVVLLLLVNFLVLACPMLIMNNLIMVDNSCGGCIFAGKVNVGTLYFIAFMSLQFHATNSALFYLILIPKYRQSFIANWRALVANLSTNSSSASSQEVS